MVAQRNDSASQWHVVVSFGLSLVLLICLFARPVYLHAEELSSPKQLPQTQTSSTDPVAPKVPTKAGSAAGSSSSTPPAQAQSTSTEPVAPKTPAKPGITAESPGSTQAQLVQAQSTSTQSTAPTVGTTAGTTMTASTGTASGDVESTQSTSSIQSFESDLFTGGASAEIPILVSPGTAGVTPKIVLRYNSSGVDELHIEAHGQRTQGQWTGLGWTLDTGGYIIRDSQGTVTADDDTFRLVFGGRTYKLKSVGSGRYRTKDETFWLINYNSTGNYWTLKTKDGTTHKFGSTANSRQTGMTFALNQEASATFTYFVDEVSTTSGTSVRYSYFKQSSSYRNRAYDQAVYIDTITYSYSNGSLVGPARTVSFLRGNRTDWQDKSATEHTSYHQLYRLDAIEVRVGSSLVRRYNFSYDYSIDRYPDYTWQGGATGDLTLKNLTMLGSDGKSPLPSLTFTYADTLLASVTNGIGGSVNYTYEKFRPLFASCLSYDNDAGRCVEWGAATTDAGDDLATSFGVIVLTNLPGTLPLYSSCVSYDNGAGRCVDWGITTTDVGDGLSTLLGYMFTTPPPVPYQTIYASCLTYDDNTGRCAEQGMTATDVGEGLSTFFGYTYLGRVDGRRNRITSRTLADGLGWSSTTNFTYWNPAIGSDGLGFGGVEFRGHAQVRATDPLSNYTDTWFLQDDLKKGRISQTEARSNTNALFNKVVNTWSTTSPATGVTFVFLSRTDDYECEGKPTCHQHGQTFTYDTNGNPTQTTSLGDVALTGDERSAVTDWIVDATNWIHRPKRSALYDSANTLVRERWMSYDNAAWGILGTRGMLTKDESRLAGGQGNAGNPTIVHAYDVYGNKTSTTDPLGCTTTILYEASQTFPGTVTNCLGHQTTMVADPRFGVMMSRTDPYRTGEPVPTTVWAYDVFGRVTKVTGPLDGSSTYGSVSTFYLDWGNPSLQRITTFRTEQHGTANYIWTEQYFDGVGRTDHTRQEGLGGQVIVSEVDYDARGQVSQSSAPHFAGETPVFTLFTYDVLGRQIQVTHPDGSHAQLVFDHDLVTSIDENGHIKRHFIDAYDRVIRVEEVNGSETYATTYQYDAANSLTRVTNQLGHQTTMIYDYLGRKFSMTDPNMGTWTYGYDKGGNLTSQTDAKNQTITFIYDSLSRILTKTYPNNQHIDWTYDDPAVANSKGRLTKVVDLAATTKFFYDVMGRVTQTQRTLGTTTYTMSQTYDALSRITSETFPDNDSASYLYNEAGWLSSVPGYINSITYNARGQKTQLVYNNGVTTNWTYNALNFRTATRVTGDINGTVQNFTYGYDPVGNITGITDGVYTGGRSFTYDALNRLSSANGNFGPNQSLTSQNYIYDPIGNILQKGTVVYSYTNPLHLSAVTSTSDGKSYTYDANGNMLTRGNQTLTWDYDNRVSALNITGDGFVNSKYDYTGIRTEKSSNLGTTLFPFEGYRIEPNGVIVKNIRVGIETFAVKKSTGEKFFYHDDHLGGVNVITGVNGLVAQLVEYEPWGKTSRLQAGGEGLLGFTGQKQDVESGLLYYGGRYYDPELGRFISPDPFVPEMFNPQALNRYSYVLNNPTNSIDPSGYFHRHHKSGGFFSSFFGIFIGAIAGFFTGGFATAAVIAADVTISASAAAVFGASFGATFGAIAGIGAMGGLNSPASIASIFTAGLFGLGDGIIGGIGFSGSTPLTNFAAGIGNGFIRGFAVGTIGSLAAGTSYSVALRNGLIGGAFASASTVAKLVYEKYVGYGPDPAPGGEAVEKPVGVPVVKGANNVGLVNCSDWGCEGQLLSKVVNQIPGMNAFAGLHDTLTQGMSNVVFRILNLPTMPPAMAFTYFSLLNGAPLNVLRGSFRDERRD